MASELGEILLRAERDRPDRRIRHGTFLKKCGCPRIFGFQFQNLNIDSRVIDPRLQAVDCRLVDVREYKLVACAAVSDLSSLLDRVPRLLLGSHAWQSRRWFASISGERKTNDERYLWTRSIMSWKPNKVWADPHRYTRTCAPKG